ncbi:PspC domain-containing protein [Paenibacillus solisilvae]|uniref:PspC domain-containing protein n=1 Tax=Paenibacillus solisilvae TaxID=2486751 RepID=A0ABW0W8D0_9BACL
MKKLYRSRRDKKLFGLCGGLAEMLNVDATLLRILLIVITVFSSGALILVYILAGLVVPKEANPFGGFGPGAGGYNPNGFGSGGYGGWNGGGHQHGSHSNPGSGYGGPYTNPPGQSGANWQQPAASASNIDAMMDDLEKKALRKEIEELRAKLAKHEKGEF